MISFGSWGKEWVKPLTFKDPKIEDLYSYKQLRFYKPFTEAMVTLAPSVLLTMCFYCTRYFECQRHLINCSYGAKMKVGCYRVQTTCALSTSLIRNMLTFHLINEKTETLRGEVMCWKFHIEGRSGEKTLTSLLLPTQNFIRKRQPLIFPKLYQS